MNKESLFEQFERLKTQILADVTSFLPKFVLAIIVVLVGWLLGRICQRLTVKLIQFLHDRLNARLRGSFLTVDLQNTARFLARTVFWIIVLFSVAIVIHLLGIPVLNSWFEGLVSYMPSILAAVVIMFAGIIASRLVGDLMGTTAVRSELSGSGHLKKLIQFMILFIAGVVAINQIGIDIQFLTNLVTIIIAALLFGAAVAFGFGARTSVSNILGSYYVQKTYQEGNHIQIGDLKGEITKITPTSVYLKTESGQVTIPAKVFNEEKSTLLNERGNGN